MSDKMREALEDARLQLEYVQEKHGYATGETILARIRAALAEAPPSRPVGGEPVAWQAREKGSFWRHCDIVTDDPNIEFRPLYATPPATAGSVESQPNSICRFCARRVFEPCQSQEQAQNACTLPPQDGGAADAMIGQIEERFPNWRSYRDLVDCIDCTLHDLRALAPKGAA